MRRGFISIIEVFLALLILFTVLNRIFIAYPPKYTDPENIGRLNRYATDIALSICNNQDMRDYLVNNTLPNESTTMIKQLNSSIPQDINYAILLFSNATGADSKLDDFVKARNPAPAPIVTNVLYLPTACTLVPAATDCLSNVNTSNDVKQSLTAGSKMLVNFTQLNGVDAFTKLELIVEATSSGAGTTMDINSSSSVLFVNQSFSVVGDEVKSFYVYEILPDRNFKYNLTLNICQGCIGQIDVDYVALNATYITYSKAPTDPVTKATSSCIISGYNQPNTTDMLVGNCIHRVSGDCTAQLLSYDDGANTSVGGPTSNFSVDFGLYTSNMRKMYFVFNVWNGSGPGLPAEPQNLTILNPAGDYSLIYSFNPLIDTPNNNTKWLTFTLPVDGVLPDANGRLNITFYRKPNGDTRVDYAKLIIQNTSAPTIPIYAPKKVVVVTWNR